MSELGEAVPERDAAIQLVEMLYEAFTARDLETLTSLLDPEIEFFPVGTAKLTGKMAPYRGHEGMSEYFRDIGEVWQELRVVPQQFEVSGARVLVLGRVYARDRDGGLVDSPAGWVWELRGQRFVSGRVFESHEEARAGIGT